MSCACTWSGSRSRADLIDTAYRQPHGVVYDLGNGKIVFFPDTAHNELYDLTAAGLVNGDDAAALATPFGTEADAL